MTNSKPVTDERIAEIRERVEATVQLVEHLSDASPREHAGLANLIDLLTALAERDAECERLRERIKALEVFVNRVPKDVRDSLTDHSFQGEQND